jgi:hypothetical protein
MPTVSDLFTLQYGHSLELNRLEVSSAPDAINFVSRTIRNNGVSARVRRIEGLEPADAGTLSVALGGQGGAGESFLQPFPYYCGRDVMVLIPKRKMPEYEKLWWATCITANRYRFGFGRQANRTLKNLVLPESTAMPDWVSRANLDCFEGAELPFSGLLGADKPCVTETVKLSNVNEWNWFTLGDLFDIERGRGTRKNALDGLGNTPFVTSSDSNNGVTGRTSMQPCHQGNTIGVNRNGSVGEAFYQPRAFCSTEDVHIFTPKFPMNQFVALFLTTIIRRESFRFGYGRKWGIERMKESTIRLPTKTDGSPDWEYMERYVKSLPFSGQL